MNQQRYRYRDLLTTVVRLLVEAGMPAEQAEVNAEILVEADAMGHTTHGINLLPAYLREIAAGTMNVSGDRTVLSDRGSAVLWDGHYLSGVFLTAAAIDEALERSKEHPVVTWSIRRAHHIGCLAAYMPKIIEHRRIGILAASDPAARMVAPYGARTAVYSPNPVAAGIPSGSGGPIIVDVSTSVTAGGVVNRHRSAGTPLPGRWILDSDGNPTDDATISGGPDSGAGAILPLGGDDAGYKGYALGLIVEALTSGLGGFGRKDAPTNWGTSVFLQIIDPDAFGGYDAFTREMTVLAEGCRTADPRPGFDDVRVPGDRALALRDSQKTGGVEVSGAIMEGIVTACRDAGIDAPRPLAGGADTEKTEEKQ